MGGLSRSKRAYLKNINENLRRSRQIERIEVGKVYVGKVVDVVIGRDPVIKKAGHPVLFLKDYGNEEFEIGDSVRYEVIRKGESIALGRFIEKV